ncbi:hypothetical protein [Kluyvera georgiana]|uniref:hypothetical protein n=1 Tax=Kluyvera georgiana TaxID=73098 RepID=UPI003D98DDA8
MQRVYFIDKKLITRILIKNNILDIYHASSFIIPVIIIFFVAGLAFAISTALWLIIVSLSLNVMIVAATYLYSLWVKTTIPEKIVLTPHDITIDNKTWRLDQIKKIKLTPNIYPINKKCFLTIIDHRGQRYRYFLGYGYGSRHVIFKEYEVFCQDMAFLVSSLPSA